MMNDTQELNVREINDPLRVIDIGDVRISNDNRMIVIAGPCQLESRQHAIDIALFLKDIAQKLGFGLIFKSSFDKANRTNISSERGIGINLGLPILAEIRDTLGIPTLTDVHETKDCRIVAQVADIIQIPAFLCRQTDLLIAAASTGRIVNVKKGQFLAPWDMNNVIRKITTCNRKVLLTERGTCFGYNMLVSDMRSLEILAHTGAPVIFDATHSVQLPGGLGQSSGGQRHFVRALARAAAAVGVAGMFLETHPDPDNAPSDGPNMIPLKEFPDIMEELLEIDHVRKSFIVRA